VRQVLAVLLCVTLGIILIFSLSGIWDDRFAVAHILHHNFNLGLDSSVAEKFNHGLAFLAAFFLLIARLQVRSRALVFLTVLYGAIWFDDSARYHERAGEKLGRALDLPYRFGLGPQEYGELLAWAILGVILALVFLWSWAGRRGGDGGVIAPFFLCFVLLALCGIGADMLHNVMPPYLDLLMQVIEDGGEMIAVTLSAALAFGVYRNVNAYFDAMSEPSED